MVGVVVNRFAGRGKAQKVYKMKILPYLNKNRIEYKTIMENSVESMQRAIRKGLDEGIRLFVVVGGDGTLNRVVETILGKDVVIVPFPGGTGNDFLKSLGRKKVDLEKIEECLNADCKIKYVDVGFVKTEIKRHIFINGLGIGFDADVLRRLKKIPLIRGDMLYFVSVIISIFKRIGMYFDLYIEDRRIRMEDVVVFDIGNGKYLGGGFKLFPHSEFTDGILSFTAIKNSKIFNVFRVLIDIMREKFTNDLIKTGEFRKITALFDREVFFHTDGDLIGKSRKFEIGILKEKLGVLV